MSHIDDIEKVSGEIRLAVKEHGKVDAGFSRNEAIAMVIADISALKEYLSNQINQQG